MKPELRVYEALYSFIGDGESMSLTHEAPLEPLTDDEWEDRIELIEQVHELMNEGARQDVDYRVEQVIR